MYVLLTYLLTYLLTEWSLKITRGTIASAELGLETETTPPLRKYGWTVASAARDSWRMHPC